MSSTTAASIKKFWPRDCFPRPEECRRTVGLLSVGQRLIGFGGGVVQSGLGLRLTGEDGGRGAQDDVANLLPTGGGRLRAGVGQRLEGGLQRGVGSQLLGEVSGLGSRLADR